MLPRAQDISLLCRHWLRAPSPERLGAALRALRELLGATGAALSGPAPVGFLTAGDLSTEGGGEVVAGEEGISRGTGTVVRSSAEQGEHRVTAVFRFAAVFDEPEMLERVNAVAQAFVDATVVAAPREERFGDYQLVARLGEGGMGQIHLARGPEGGLVALKRISRPLAAEPRFLEMFSREVQAATQIAHPNVVRILEYGVCDGQAFLVMEYLQGASLARVSYGAQALGLNLSLEVILGLALRYCRGLEAAHRVGIVHCDISPQNLFVTFEGEAKVIDFGLARLPSALQQRKEPARGKLGYVAPEQLVGELFDHRADLFALGVVLYELFARRAVDATWRTYAGSGLPPLGALVPDLPDALTQLVMRVVSFTPQDRPENATGLERLLREAAASSQVVPAPAEAISLFMRNALGDSEAHQKRLLSGPVSGPVGPNTRTTRLE
ncbi:MAG: serine/threonine protein kinase [Myxococcota bacterium]|nr:serine/threonine protein kinase [Myxococcota bacterium]